MTTTLRYLVFGGEFPTEPNGGMRDLLKRKAIRAEAIAWAEGYLARSSSGWAHVWDAQEGKEVWASDRLGGDPRP